MRRYLRQVALFLLLQVCVGLLVWSRYRPDHDAYVAVFRNKHQRLRNASGRRLILLGGSNVALGLSAEQLTQLTHLNAVNMGIHANLGREFMLAEVAADMRQGDVVVLSPEYQQFDKAPPPHALMQLLELAPEGRDYLSINDLPRFSDEGLVLAGERVRRAFVPHATAAPPYSLSSFNEYGDAIAHHGMPARRPLAPFYFEDLSDRNVAHAADSFQQFGTLARSRGVRVFYLFPPVPQATFDKYQPEIQRIEGAVAKAGLVRLNSPYAYQDDCFFDTAYHLTEPCSERRTAELAGSLASAMK